MQLAELPTRKLGFVPNNTLGETETGVFVRQRRTRRESRLRWIRRCFCPNFPPNRLGKREGFSSSSRSIPRCLGPDYMVQKQKMQRESRRDSPTDGKRAQFCARNCPYFPGRQTFQ